MIVQETYELNGQHFVRTFSDEGRYVVGGVPEWEYVEANDLAELGRSYTEGGLIPDEEREGDAEEILDILLGGDGE